MSELSEYSPLVHREADQANMINASTVHAERGPRVVYDEYVRPMLGELIGTMLFVCVGVLCVRDGGMGPTPNPPIIAIGHGFTIVLLVAALGNISGGHINPSVTLGVLLGGGISPVKAVLYIIGQLAGGLLGAGLSRAILPTSEYKDIGGGAHTLADSITPGEGVLCEVVLTTLLVLTVLLTAVDPKTKSPLAPVAIGFAVTVDILAGLPLTGASMNPARSLGPAVFISFATSKYWNYHYIYWVGPFSGSFAAGLFYRLCLASPEKRLVFKS